MIDYQHPDRNPSATMRAGRELRDTIRLAVSTVIEYQAVGTALPQWIEDLPAIVWVTIDRRVRAHDGKADVVHHAALCTR